MLSNQVKKELIQAMQDNASAMFVVDGKLVSVEMEEVDSSHEETNDLLQEIEDNPELKSSLQRYIDRPEMKRYTVEQLKDLRNERRQ